MIRNLITESYTSEGVLDMNVYVFGLGHIGLPMAVWIALKEHAVFGIDVNPKHVQAIIEGNISIEEYYEEKHIAVITKDLLNANKLKVQDKYYREDYNPSVFVITVGIADRENGTQDISPIQNVVNDILPSLVDGDLLIFKTTMIPGTIDNIVLPQVKALNKEIYIAYSPETISETSAFYELEHNERILSAMDEVSYDIAEKFLKSLTDSRINRASSIKLAETVKVIQNIDRDVNIALIHEISEVAMRLGIDIHELRKLSNTHPRVHLLEPGPGVGGYCLPNALKYLHLAVNKENQKRMNLMNTARNINDKRPKKIVSYVKEILKGYGKDIKLSKIAGIGLAMKDYCADDRYSPALEIINHLLKEGADVRGYDPLVTNKVVGQVNTYDEAITGVDCIIITAKQKDIILNPDEIAEKMNKPAIIIDTRNAAESHSNILLYKI